MTRFGHICAGVWLTLHGCLNISRLEIVLNLDELMELILELLVDQPDLVATYRQVYASARSHGR